MQSTLVNLLEHHNIIIGLLFSAIGLSILFYSVRELMGNARKMQIISKPISRNVKQAQATQPKTILPKKDLPLKRANSASIDLDDLQFLSGDDVQNSKLDIARAYIDMGEYKKAEKVLKAVMNLGSSEQRSAAKFLYAELNAVS